jgi:cyclopropane fatty-acyl-phospholipid synthase-like methyltransferase
LSDFDDLYATAAVFGTEPDPLLLRHVHRLAPAATVLDLGSGQGRHTLFLAHKGHAVVALDPSEVATQTVRDRVRDRVREQTQGRSRELSVTAIQGGFADHRPGPVYDAVLAFGLIQLLSPEELARLIRRVAEWLAPGGLLFVTAFTTDDPAYPPKPGGLPMWLEPGEIVRLFADLNVIEHREGLGPWHHHGDGQPQRHAMAEAVFRRS